MASLFYRILSVCSFIWFIQNILHSMLDLCKSHAVFRLPRLGSIIFYSGVYNLWRACFFNLSGNQQNYPTKTHQTLQKCRHPNHFNILRFCFLQNHDNRNKRINLIVSNIPTFCLPPIQPDLFLRISNFRDNIRTSYYSRRCLAIPAFLLPSYWPARQHTFILRFTGSLALVIDNAFKWGKEKYGWL